MVKVTNIFIGLKKTYLGVLERGDRDKDNETGLTEGGGIEMSTTVLSIYAMLAPSLEYLPVFQILICPSLPPVANTLDSDGCQSNVNT